MKTFEFERMEKERQLIKRVDLDYLDFVKRKWPSNVDYIIRIIATGLEIGR